MQHQHRRIRSREQEVVASLHRIMGGALEQVGEKARLAAAGGEQVSVVGERVGVHGRHGRRSVQLTRRNTRVPLVPPNPKELDNTTSIFILRALWGT